MTHLLKFLSKRHPWFHPSSDQTSDGFTMIELLVGTIMSTLIIVPLLGVVTSILNDDTQEQAKTTTDYEIQAAADFIAEDLSQAFYIYGKEDSEPRVDTRVGPLPDRGTPIIVFWKRQRLPYSYPPVSQTGEQTNPEDCTPDTCDDIYVKALVAYYLVDGNNDTAQQRRKWCQPSGNDCPQRIERYVFQDSLKTRTGLEYPDGALRDSQKRSDGFNQNFDLSLLLKKDDPDAEAQAREGVTTGNSESPQVLVNYIHDFRLDSVSADKIVARFTIIGDARRRMKASGIDCENSEGTPFCPKASMQINGIRIK